MEQSEITFVFLPGLDGTGLSFTPLQEKMPADVQVTVVKYPVDRLLSFSSLVLHAYGQLPENKPLVLIAESFSGPIAIRLATSFPSNIKGIVFCATFARSPHPLFFGVTKYIPLSLLFRLPVPAFLLYFLCGGKAFSQKLIPLFRQLEKLVKPEVVAQRIRMLADSDVVGDLKKLTLPCCYIQGLRDMIVPARSLIPFEQFLPGLIVRRVDGPHGILQAKPEDCFEIIEEFVRGLPAGE